MTFQSYRSKYLLVVKTTQKVEPALPGLVQVPGPAVEISCREG